MKFSFQTQKMNDNIFIPTEDLKLLSKSGTKKDSILQCHCLMPIVEMLLANVVLPLKIN